MHFYGKIALITLPSEWLSSTVVVAAAAVAAVVAATFWKLLKSGNARRLVVKSMVLSQTL